MISMSEVGKDSPTAFDPNSTASEYGYIDLTIYRILSNAITLLSNF